MALLKPSTLALSMVVLAGCSLSPESGQFRCDLSDACPSGMTCVDNICQVGTSTDSGPTDAGPDSGPGDTGPTDTGPMDVGADVDAGPLLEERCSPDMNGVPADEDSDGITDEGCPWFFGTPHAVTIAQTNAKPYGGSFSADGLTIYTAPLDTGAPVQMRTRPSLDSLEFGPSMPVAGTEVVAQAQVTVSVDARADTLATQSQFLLDSFVRIYELQGAVYRERQVINDATHPWLSSDGLTLYLTRGELGAKRIYAYTRDSFGSDFAEPRELDLGGGSTDVPTLTPDQLNLFFSRSDGVYVASRRSTDDAFSGSVQLEGLDELFRPMYIPAAREMWLGDAVAVTREPRFVRRAQVCRDVACRETPVSCPEPDAIPVGPFTCFWVNEAPLSFGEANDACGDGAHLAVETRPSERFEIRFQVGWIGARRMGGQFEWITAEPMILNRPWRGGMPGADDCVYRESTLWATDDCTQMRASICERTAFPTW